MPILSVIGLLRQIVRVCLCQPARTATPPATPLVRHTSVSFRTLASLPRSLSTRPAAPLRVRQIPDLRSPLQNAKRMESIKEIPFRDILLTTEPFLHEITSHRLINSKQITCNRRISGINRRYLCRFVDPDTRNMELLERIELYY